MRSREDLLGACEGRSEWYPPGVCMEHGHHRQRHVDLAKRKRISRQDPQGVQRQRSVRVNDSFRSPGGPRGVAHRSRLVLIRLGVRKLARVGSLQQFLVGVRAFRCCPALRDDDHVIQVHLVCELLIECQEGLVHEERPVPCVVDDVGELVRVESQV
jgi:hypothetical protein